MARTEFRLPDLGEGLTEAEILQWLVAVGDEVAVNEPLLEVETAKASVEIPSPVAGVVRALRWEAGQLVPVGAVLLDLESSETEGQRPESRQTREPDGHEPVLVGYGPSSETPRRRRRRPFSLGRESHGHEPVPAQLRGAPPLAPRKAGPGDDPGPVRAKPPVRKLARDLGVDLLTITGSGAGGLVTRDDVKRARVSQPGLQESPSPEGQDQRTPIRGIRRATAEAMQRSAAVPTASVRLAVDVTETLRARSRLADLPETEGTPVTVLAFAARALLLALRRRPMLHARWDEESAEIITPHHVDLGIAVASSRGLLVPKIRAAEGLPLIELVKAIARVAATARGGRPSPEDLRHGTITITNVGVFDVDSGTPLLTPGESAILCLGAVRERPWVVDGALAVRQVVELTLTFDHRVLDGEEASRFLSDVGAVLREPVLMLVRS